MMEDSISMLAKRATPTPTGSRRRSWCCDWPSHLVAQARRRLGFLAGLLAALFVVDLVFSIDLTRADPAVIGADIAAIILAIIVVLLVLWRRIPTEAVLNVGLLFEVAFCFIISLSMTAFHHSIFGTVPIMDFVTPVIIMFPLIVPTPPRRALVASLAAASAPPLSVLFLGWTGTITLEPIAFPGASVHPALAVIWSPLVAVVIAGFASHWVYGLGTDIAKARELGSYKLTSLLGRGGMGEVWRAEHRLLARPAAIKLVRPEVLAGGAAESAEQAVRRFEREAQATAAMRSPHTIQVYDFGVSDQGVFYYVMELLQGLSCDVIIRRYGPQPAARVVHLLRQVCSSLAEAHDAGLIHRDIKPANVFVCVYGREVDFVKVLDFGLVKPQSEFAGDVQLTGEQVTVGSPAFMAPEQVLGDRPLDGRTDLYAVGCLGYWLLTGQYVFEGETAMEILLHHARTEPTALSKRTELHVPEGLERLILQCLEKEPARRPASAELLGERLAACTDGTSWTPELARRWWSLHGPGAADAPAPLASAREAIKPRVRNISSP